MRWAMLGLMVVVSAAAGCGPLKSKQRAVTSVTLAEDGALMVKRCRIVLERDWQGGLQDLTLDECETVRQAPLEQDE